MLVALPAPGPAGAGAPESRWIVYVQGSLDEEVGALRAIRSNGRGDRELIPGSVLEADLGPRRTAYVTLRGEEGDSLARLSVAEGEPENLAAGPEASRLFGLAVSADDRVALQRFVSISQDVPRHLEDALPSLARAGLPVLAPPRRPPGTTATLGDSSRRSFDLTFTNDPEGELSHAEQVNVFISGTTRRFHPPPEATPVEVRGTTGTFFCGASACFLDWEENDARYSVGEFGSEDQAVAFAESLRPLEDLAGPAWRAPGDLQAPQLVVLRDQGELVLESVEDFCECSFRPADWSEDGSRLLVTTAAEGFTTVLEYGAGGEPTTLEEATGGTGALLDAGYGPDGPLVLETSGFGTAGVIRPVGGGDPIVEDAIGFDVEGPVLAWVTSDGVLMVRDLETGEEGQIAEGARSVGVSPQAARRRPPPSPPVFPAAPETEGFPLLLVVGLASAGAALVAGTIMVIRGRRR